VLTLALWVAIVLAWVWLSALATSLIATLPRSAA